MALPHGDVLPLSRCLPEEIKAGERRPILQGMGRARFFKVGRSINYFNPVNSEEV